MSDPRNNGMTGHRGPQFVPEEPLAERLLHMLVAMATELAATHERVDTLERLLTETGTLAADGVDNFVPDNSADSARKAWREQFLDRIFEQLQNEIDRAGTRPAGERDQ